MKLKILGLILLFASPCYAGNNGAEAFATGFANAMNRRMGGREYQAPSYNQEQVNVNVDVTPKVDQYYDAVNASGTFGGFNFASRWACERFVQRSAGVYGECSLVETR